MIVGEHVRAEDLDVNAVRPKKQTNVRSSGADEAVSLTPKRSLTLDEAPEYVREDECVEVTPEGVRLRKVALDAVSRQKAARKRARGEATVSSLAAKIGRAPCRERV